MIHLVLPFGLASILAGAGVYAILARRNAVLMLIGVELVLAAANLVLVTTSAILPDPGGSAQIMSLFVITLAAAEVTLALGIILYAFRARGHIDLGEGLDADEVRADTREVTGENSGAREASATATAASPAATSTTSSASSASSPEVTS
ncbi:NADH-quinone oxidoreductase subunit NuoK [Dermacoccus nishinomiyaensis]|uniref:NADH-quinone oxidoreductase subunit NuoK n=1 Tax=Dermacoccus nishinomiyaensis TaxID=1274 RepID=UPI001F505373|nr:NADH-quinone oxidoreductase subunit NuoK [Dermacoccus nishinomiyaensis]MCI0154347.1 NADH-quinone oxidoreductase subunit NuoK [Dermacoccus nishinomiyaensis]